MSKNYNGYVVEVDNKNVVMYHSEKGWEAITDDLNLTRYGFIKKDNYYYKVIEKNGNIKAFNFYTFCKYNGGNYLIENNSGDNVLLYPTIETHSQIGLHPYDERRVLIPYNEFIKNVEEIWEERKPIEGFKFVTESIFYLKKSNSNKILEWYVRKPLNLKKGSELWFVYEDDTEEFKSIVKENENRELIFEQVVLPTFYDNNKIITFVIDDNPKRYGSFDTSIVYFREKYQIKEKELYYNKNESSFFKFDLNISQLELVFSKELGTVLYVNCDMTKIDFLIVYQWAKELYNEIFKK
jgi:hypothetical protein